MATTDEDRGSRYRGEPMNIPFFVQDKGYYIIRLKVRQDQCPGAEKIDIAGDGLGLQWSPGSLTAANRSFLKNRATIRFITYYFPEFYTFLYDRDKFETIPNANLSIAEELFDEIKSRVQIDRLDTTSGDKFLIIVSLRYNPYTRRSGMKVRGEVPSYEENLAFFNEKHHISGTNAQSTFVIGSILSTNNSLNDGLQAFNQQADGLGGLSGLNVDFGFAQSSTQRAIHFAVDLLTKALEISPGAGGATPEFNASDSMTIYFGKRQKPDEDSKLAITRIEYTLIEESRVKRTLSIGYFSNIKYNKTLTDPLTLLILKNHEMIMAAGGPNAFGQGMQGTPGNPAGSFFDFMSSVAGGEAGSEWATMATDTGAGGITSIFNPQNPLHGPREFGNTFINAAKAMGSSDFIDIGDTEELEKGFKTAFSSAELKALKLRIADNPAIFKAVMAEQKDKAMDNVKKVADVVANLAETGPMGLMEKNPVLNLIFKQLGIKEIAKEAMICLLFGAAIPVGRIANAISKTLTNSRASMYYPPDLPAVADISKPFISKEDFPIFAIKGEFKKAMLKIIVDSLQQAVLQIIKKLSDLLKYNCPLNNPRAEDVGDTDINDLIPPQDINIGGPSSLDYIASQRGLTPQEITDYLFSLSSVLTSMDICILFTRRSAVSPDLLETVIDFNEDYDIVPYFQTKVITPSQVMSFFYETSQFVDVAPLCNEIANEVYVANQENISLCLTPANMPTEELEELMDLAENGIQLNFPEINLDCPDRENFINDPTITVTVPETFNMLAELVELQFIESAESLKTILLSPAMTAPDGGYLLDNLKAANVDYSDNGWPPKIDKAILSKIIKALDKIADYDLSECPVDLPSLLGLDAAMAMEMGADVTNMVSDTMSSPAFTESIEEVRNSLLGIASGDYDPGPGPPVFTTYKFNDRFFWDFVDYIDIREINYSYPTVSIPTHYNSTLIDDSRPYSGSLSPAEFTGSMDQPLPIIDGSYKPIEINFNFPSSTPFLFEGHSAGSTDASFPAYDLQSHAYNMGGAPGECRDQARIQQLNFLGLTTERDEGCAGTHGVGADGISWEKPEDPPDPPPPLDPGAPLPTCPDSVPKLVGKILYRLLINKSDGEPYYVNTPAGQAALSPVYGGAEGWQPFSTYSPMVYAQLRYSSSRIKKIPPTEMNPIMLGAVKQWLTDPRIKGRLLPSATYGGIINDLILKREHLERGDCAIRIAVPDEVTKAERILGPLLGGAGDDAIPDNAAQYIYDQVMDVEVTDLLVVRNYLKIVYPREATSTQYGPNPNVYMKFESAGDFIPKDRFIVDIAASAGAAAFETPVNHAQNVYIKQFVDAFGGIVPGGGSGVPVGTAKGAAPHSPGRTEAAEIEAKHFPIVYGILVDNMINYLVRNGVFDAATLQSLTLFHLNQNCPPEEAADLLGVDTILEQMLAEYLEASCCPDTPPTPQRIRIRNMIKLGMYLLVIQIHVAEIVLKNIFVFAAFELDSLIADPNNFIFKFLRSQITNALLNFFAGTTNASESMIRRDLTGYFNKKMLRDCVIEAGGIKNAKGEIVFPVGTTFSMTDKGIGFDEILDYLISDRLILGGDQLNNAIKTALPDGNPVQMKKAFLKSIPTYNVDDDSLEVLGGDPTATDTELRRGIVPLVFGSAPRTYQVFFTRKRIGDRCPGPRSRIILWYYHTKDTADGESAGNLVALFRFSGTVPTGEYCPGPPESEGPPSPGSTGGGTFGGVDTGGEGGGSIPYEPPATPPPAGGTGGGGPPATPPPGGGTGGGGGPGNFGF